MKPLYYLRLFITGLIRYIPEPFGIFLRRINYKGLLRRCGKKLKVYEGVVIRRPENIELGDNVVLTEYCLLQAKGNITIGNNVEIGSGTKMYTFNQGRPQDYMDIGEISIGDNTWIGCNVVILKDTHIGSNCIIGASTLVNHDVPDDYLSYGVPNILVERI